MSGAFWLIVGVVILMILVAYLMLRPRPLAGEAGARAAAGKSFKGSDDERMWWFVGWDDHFMHKRPFNRPSDMAEPIRRAYDAGYQARIAWSLKETAL